MHLYDFEVLKDGAVVSVERAVVLRDARAAWPEVERLAGATTRAAARSGSRTKPAASSS